MVDESSPATLQRLAINCALNCRWEEAIQYNERIIADDPENTDCLNRIAKAYMELGKHSQAKKIYQEVLKIDPYNIIAEKNLKRVNAIKKADTESGDSNHVPTNGHSMIYASSFLEEPGVTTSVTLIKVAEPQRLLTLSAGNNVNLVTKSRGISITDYNEKYIGALPDDIAHHLLKLIEGGNKYQAFIKSITTNKVVILIRETHRSKKFKNQASFLDNSKIFNYSSDHLALITEKNEEEPSNLPIEETEEQTY